ncbi:hypothetical protein MKW92_020279 [Papaver armeniacum]|nr:hypothetical protein MKW92_020279 [Papaver armeniacum]
MKFHVADASLTRFNLTSDGILHYDLTFNITVRNSNKKIGIWYEQLESTTSCYGKDLGLVSLTPFRQGPKNTTLLRPVLQGITSLSLQGSNLRDFNNDQTDGSYSIFLNFNVIARLKYPGVGGSRPWYYKVKCGLVRLPLLLVNSSTHAGLFNTRRCKVSFYKIM